jgi:hypothetical protein
VSFDSPLPGDLVDFMEGKPVAVGPEASDEVA